MLHDELYFSDEIKAFKNEHQFNFTIQLRGIIDRTPDCKIGDFGSNYWIRTKAALNPKFEGYKDAKTLKKAVKLSLLKRGFTGIKWVEGLK